MVYNERAMSSKPLITRLAALVLACALTLASSSCSPLGRGANEDELSGRILFWHSWSGQEAAVLADMLSQFSALHPRVRIITTTYSEDVIQRAYSERTRAGLGPDLLLVESAVAYDLAEAGVVRELTAGATGNGVDSARPATSPDRFQNSPYQMVSDGQRLLGLPFAVHTQVLFFDRQRVQPVPITTDQLADMARTGLPIAMQSGYPATHWLLGTYYGRTLNDAGRLELERGGVVNWLDRLQVTLSARGVFTGERAAPLRQRLADGTAAFYVGDSSELPLVRQSLGEERTGVTTLPIGPFNGPASPMLQTDTLVFSPVTNTGEQAIALRLAEFLTNPQMQLQLAAADIGRIPAGAEPSVGANLPAGSLVVSRQIRTAQVIPLALRPSWNVLTEPGGPFESGYRAALAGVVSPIEFVTTATATLTAQHGMERETAGSAVACPEQAAAATLWHSLPTAEAAVLNDIVRRFAQTCPGNTITLTFVAEEALFDGYVAEAERGAGPDALLSSSRWLPQLAERDLIRDIADEVSPEQLQTFIPAAVVNLTYRNRPYAIPESIANAALVFNRTQVTDPPIDLDGLLSQAAVGRRVALPVGFFNAYWGMTPLGAFEFDSNRGIFSAINGLSGWLEWLQQNQNRPGMSVTFDERAAEAEFLAGEAAFLVTGPWSLPRLRARFAPGDLAVASLPFGPFGAGAPLLQTNGIMINSRAAADVVSVAVAFAHYLSLPESQTLLSQTGTRVSANVMVNLGDFPLLNGFREQSRTSEIAIENQTFADMEALADEAYRAVLEEGENPLDATADLVAAVHGLPEE